MHTASSRLRARKASTTSSGSNLLISCSATSAPQSGHGKSGLPTAKRDSAYLSTHDAQYHPCPQRRRTERNAGTSMQQMEHEVGSVLAHISADASGAARVEEASSSCWTSWPCSELPSVNSASGGAAGDVLACLGVFSEASTRLTSPPSFRAAPLTFLATLAPLVILVPCSKLPSADSASDGAAWDGLACLGVFSDVSTLTTTPSSLRAAPFVQTDLLVRLAPLAFLTTLAPAVFLAPRLFVLDFSSDADAQVAASVSAMAVPVVHSAASNPTPLPCS
mmetsp:Transcript_66385/g.130814  ORF Transcript_66385/g.130814 Transcript_66385/m.130814 type:complete len:278 (-) Transcript_66385:1104-1937(-)